MEREMKNINIRVPVDVYMSLASFTKSKGSTVSGYCRKVIEMEMGYPERWRLEVQERHEEISELIRRIIVTTAAEKKLCNTWDEFENFQMLEKVCRWKFEEPKGEGK